MKYTVVVIPNGKDITEGFVLCSFDDRLFSAYEYIQKKGNKYNLSAYELLTWIYYRNHIDIDAELFCDKDAIRKRYKYYADKSDADDIIKDNSYFFCDGMFKETLLFNVGELYYSVPVIDVMNKKKYNNKGIVQTNGYLKAWYYRTLPYGEVCYEGLKLNGKTLFLYCN